MRRMQVQLDDAVYEAVRRRACEQGRSMASVVRETLSEVFGGAAGEQDAKRTAEDFTFVGMGRDPDPPSDVPVSVDHDKWFAEAIAGPREALDKP